MENNSPKVFISYSHDSETHNLKVLSFAKQLRKEGVNATLRQYLNAPPPEGWHRWTINQLEQADFILLVCTQQLYNEIKDRKEQGKIIDSFLHGDDGMDAKFIPVLFDKADEACIPRMLRATDKFVVSNRGEYFSLYRRLTNQPSVTANEVGNLTTMSETEVPDFFEQTTISARPTKIDLARLPTTSTPLFGRQDELKLLDAAWDNSQTRIFSLVAFGGVGKTALVNEWLNRMDAQNFKGAVRVYGWSFYSQGTREDGQASADGFIQDAISWFGGEIAATASPFEKGRYLAQLIARQPTLLVLDGLEPLQYPPGPMYGRLKDQSMQALLKGLARSMNGLCLISTRCEVEELKPTKDRFTPTHELEQLSLPAGVQLLQHFGLRGSKKDFEQTVQEFKGHALALNLIGSYLRTVHEGDLRRRDTIPAILEEEKQGGHARRVMAGYEHWFKDKPELDVLHLLGLFDRPVEMEVIDVLKAAPAIPGLTDKLQDLSHAQWQTALQHLRDAKLLNKDTHTFDCHPLVREHFGEQLQTHYPHACTAAHSRLYDYYKNLPKKELPDTLEEMEPLFLAVRHGCLAGKYYEAKIDVYWKRIRRESEAYTVHKLGAIGTDLNCLAHFFESVWDKPAESLPEPDKAVILGWAGFRLQAVGRLEEAAQPTKVATEVAAKNENWKNAATSASTLSELLLTIGQIPAAIEYGRQSVAYADRSGDGFQKESKRTTLADTYLQAGHFQQAQTLFQEAEQLQQKRQPGYPYLYSLQGFRYCDLLLAQGQYKEVMERAKTTFNWAIEYRLNLLTLALDVLSIGKTLFQPALQTTPTDFSEAAHYLHQAVEGLRKAGTQHYLPLGLLARTALYWEQQHYALAWEDLDEVLEIATYGSMQLHLTDYYLEGARVLRAQLREERPAYTIQENGEVVSLSRSEAEATYWAFVAQAAALIQETGYHRRDGELEELQGTRF